MRNWLRLRTPRNSKTCWVVPNVHRIDTNHWRDTQLGFTKSSRETDKCKCFILYCNILYVLRVLRCYWQRKSWLAAGADLGFDQRGGGGAVRGLQPPMERPGSSGNVLILI